MRPGNTSDAYRRSRLLRGIIFTCVGIAFVAAGIGVAVYRYLADVPGGRYIGFPLVLFGFAVLVRGLFWWISAAEDRVFEAADDPRTRTDSVYASGFKTFVALRYLMSRHRRISRVVLVAVVISLFIGTCGLLLDHVLNVRGPFDLETDSARDLADVITGLKIGGFVLACFALVIGALRYVFSFFTTVPLVGVWIGTGALVCVLSVMSGFESDLRTKILGANAHVQVTREDGDFTEWRDVKRRIDAIPGVVASTPYATSEVVLAATNNGSNVIIKGIDPRSVGTVTELVSDLEDADAMKRLEPLVPDAHDLSVAQPAGSGSGSAVEDPPPPDMPHAGEPIDYSKPEADLPAGSGSGSDSGGDGVDVVTDPPPPDLLATDDPPIDYSQPRTGDVDPSIHVVDIPDEPVLSRRTQALPGILVGKELVKQMHLYTGEEVRLVSPLSDPSNPDATGTPIPFNRDYRVAGSFFTGMYEYDLKYVYVTLDSLQEFLDRGDAVDGIEVRVPNPDDADRYVATISAQLGPQYRVQSWQDLNHSLFSALKLEKVAMFIVLGIVILVASFSILGNLIMVVVEKAREIALLKTLGASDGTILLVFAIQGLLIGVIGTALGVGTGLAACWAGKTFGIPLNPEVYYIDRMPVHVETSSVVFIACAGVLFSIIATFYPAIVAARVRPAAGMRH
ncbi:MAG TPA: ABC transporter permease [Kofleriaceae bacterium]|nr:ABC transporter permease [Kofleriaceae bacterium]